MNDSSLLPQPHHMGTGSYFGLLPFSSKYTFYARFVVIGTTLVMLYVSDSLKRIGSGESLFVHAVYF